MANDNEIIRDISFNDGFSLESILAEYKGSAYIDGEKKTPTELLDEQIDSILREEGVSEPSGLNLAGPFPERERTARRSKQQPQTRGENEARGRRRRQAAADDAQEHGSATEDTLLEELVPDNAAAKNAAANRIARARSAPPGAATADSTPSGAVRNDIAFDDAALIDTELNTEPASFDRNAAVSAGSAPGAEAPDATAPETGHADVVAQQPVHRGETDKDILFFENYGLTEAELQSSIVRDVEKAIARELGRDDERPQPGHRGLNLLGRSKTAAAESGGASDSAADEDEVFEEPELSTAARRFAIACNSISLRSFPAALITLFMLMLTFSYESGKIIPFGIGRSYVASVSALMIALLLVMMLGIDILIRGAVSLLKGNPNAETLILFSCVFSLISGTFSVVKNTTGVLSYSAVSALSLTFAAFGERSSLRAITETLKTAAASAEPFGLQAEYNGEIDKSVLKKVSQRTDGFYNSLMHPDVSETAYRYATPLLLAAALILSVFTVLVKNRGEYFLHILSAMLASAAPFSAMLSFSVPFGTVAKSMRKSGAAVAGWGGADDICFSDGACVTDDDLFPPGTLSFSGAQITDGVSKEKAVRYTASLIIASGSGASHLFSEVLKSQSMSVIKVDDFACYEGGVGALVRGERVMTGSAAFMNLIGIKVPDDMNMKNALYTAFDSKLAALFIIDYEPRVSVQGALISIIKWRIKLFFAVRDFNITPLMLEQKFKVSLEDFEYVQTRDAYNISNMSSSKDGRISAVLSREGLVPFAEAVTGGRLLKSAALASTVISIISAALGVIYMFYMCWAGALASAKPGNLILFMLSMLAAVLVVCGYARCRK